MRCFEKGTGSFWQTRSREIEFFRTEGLIGWTATPGHPMEEKNLVEQAKTKLSICMLVNLPHVSGPAELGPASREGLVTYLASFGHSMTWINPSEAVSGVQQCSSGSVRVVTTPSASLLGGSSLIGKAVNRALNVPRRIRAIAGIAAVGDYDLTFVKGDVPDGFAAMYVRKRHGTPFVFNSEPLGMVWEVYKLKSRRPRALHYLVARLHDMLTLYLTKRADLVTPSSRWFGEALAERGIPENRIAACPNGVDITRFSGSDGQDIRNRYQLGDSRVILYTGTLDTARGLGVLIEAFAKVKERGRSAKLLIVGEGTGKEELERMVAELELEADTVFAGQVRGSDLPDYVAAADIGISPINPLSCYTIGSPLKIFEYMAAGKPVVANEEIFDQREVLEQSAGGLLAPFNSDAFADAMIQLLDDPEQAARMGQNGRQWVTERRTYEVLARQLERRFTELVLQRKAAQSH